MQTLNRIYDTYKSAKRFRRLWTDFVQLAETLPSRNEPASSSSIGSRNQDHAVEYNTGAPYGIDVWPEREVAIVRARALLTHAPVTAGGGGTDGQQPVVSPDELSADGSAFVALSVRLLFELARDTDFRQSQSKEHELSYSDVFGRLLQLLLYCCRDNRFSSKLRISGAACEAVVVLVVDSLGGRLLHQHAGSPVSSALWLLQLLVFVSTNSELGKKYLREYRGRLLRSFLLFLQRAVDATGATVTHASPVAHECAPSSVKDVQEQAAQSDLLMNLFIAVRTVYEVASLSHGNSAEDMSEKNDTQPTREAAGVIDIETAGVTTSGAMATSSAPTPPVAVLCQSCRERTRVFGFGDSSATAAGLASRRQLIYSHIKEMQVDIIPRISSMLHPPCVGEDDACYIDALLTALLVDLTSAARSEELVCALMDFLPLFLSHSFEKSIMFAALGGNFALVSMLIRVKSTQCRLMHQLDIARFFVEILSAVTTGCCWQCSCRLRNDSILFFSDSANTDKDQLTDDELLSMFCSSHLSLHYIHLLSALCLSNQAELVVTGCRIISRLVEMDPVNAVAIEVAGGFSALLSIVSRELSIRRYHQDASWILSLGVSTMLDPMQSPACLEAMLKCGYTASTCVLSDAVAREYLMHSSHESAFSEEESVRVLCAALHALRHLDAVLSREGRDDAAFALCCIAEAAISQLKDSNVTELPLQIHPEKSNMFLTSVCGSLNKVVLVFKGSPPHQNLKCCICRTAAATSECIHESCIKGKTSFLCQFCDKKRHDEMGEEGNYHARIKLSVCSNGCEGACSAGLPAPMGLSPETMYISNRHCVFFHPPLVSSEGARVLSCQYSDPLVYLYKKIDENKNMMLLHAQAATRDDNSSVKSRRMNIAIVLSCVSSVLDNRRTQFGQTPEFCVHVLMHALRGSIRVRIERLPITLSCSPCISDAWKTLSESNFDTILSKVSVGESTIRHDLSHAVEPPEAEFFSFARVVSSLLLQSLLRTFACMNSRFLRNEMFFVSKEVYRNALLVLEHHGCSILSYLAVLHDTPLISSDKHLCVWLLRDLLSILIVAKDYDNAKEVARWIWWSLMSVAPGSFVKTNGMQNGVVGPDAQSLPHSPIYNQNEWLWLVLLQELRVVLCGCLDEEIDFRQYLGVVEIAGDTQHSMADYSYLKLIGNVEASKCIVYFPRQRRIVQQVLTNGGILIFLAEYLFGKFAPAGLLKSLFSEIRTQDTSKEEKSTVVSVSCVLSWWHTLACFTQLIVSNDAGKDALCGCSVSIDGILTTLACLISTVSDNSMVESLLLLVFELNIRRGYILPGGIFPFPTARLSHFMYAGLSRGHASHQTVLDGSFGDTTRALLSKTRSSDSVLNMCSHYVISDSTRTQVMRLLWNQSYADIIDESRVSESASVDTKSIATSSSGPIFGAALASQLVASFEGNQAAGFAPSRSSSIEKLHTNGSMSRSVETFLRLHSGHQRRTRSDSFASLPGSISNLSACDDEPVAGDGPRQPTKILLNVISAVAGPIARNTSHTTLGDGFENHSISAENIRDSDILILEASSPKIDSERLIAHNRATQKSADDQFLYDLLQKNIQGRFYRNGEPTVFAAENPTSSDFHSNVIQSSYHTFDSIHKELAVVAEQLKPRSKFFQSAVGLSEALRASNFPQFIFSSPNAALEVIAICSVLSGHVQRAGFSVLSRMVQENILNASFLATDDVILSLLHYVLEGSQSVHSSVHGVLVGLLRRVFDFKLTSGALQFLVDLIAKTSRMTVQEETREKLTDEISRTAFFILGQSAEARQLESFLHFTGQSPFKCHVDLKFAKEVDFSELVSNFHLKSWLRLAPFLCASNRFIFEVLLTGVNNPARKSAVHVFCKSFSVPPRRPAASDVVSKDPNVVDGSYIRLCISVLDLVQAPVDPAVGIDRLSFSGGKEEEDWSTDYGTYTVNPVAAIDRGFGDCCMDSNLAQMLAKYAVPDVVVDLDWSDHSSWHHLAIDFICADFGDCGGVPFCCAVDGVLAPLLMWTPSGYIECANIKSQRNSPSQHLWSSIAKTKVTSASIGGTSALQQEYEFYISKCDSEKEPESQFGVLLEGLAQSVHGLVGDIGATAVEAGSLDVVDLGNLVSRGAQPPCISGDPPAPASVVMQLTVARPTITSASDGANMFSVVFPLNVKATISSPKPEAISICSSLFHEVPVQTGYLKFLLNKEIQNESTFMCLRAAAVLLVERRSISSVIVESGGLHVLFGKLCCHRKHQVASIRILSSLLYQNVSDYFSFTDAGGFNLALFGLCRHPQSAKPCHTAVEVLQILFDLAVTPLAQSEPIQGAKATDILHRVEILRLLVDLACTNVTKPKIARCVVDWLRSLCEDRPENLKFVLDNVGVVSFLVLLSAWSVVECDVLYKSTSMSAYSTTQSRRNSHSSQQSPDRSGHRAGNRFDAAKEISRLQLSTARFLRQLMTGSFGEVLSGASMTGPNAMSISTGFATVHLEQVFNFIILVASRFAGVDKFEGVGDVAQVQRSGFEHLERAAQLSMELLSGVLAGPLGKIYATMIRNIWGQNLASVALDLMASAHMSVKLGALNLLCLLLSDPDGYVDAKQLTTFEKSGGFHCMASVLPIGMSKRMLTETSHLRMGNSSDDGSIASIGSMSNKEHRPLSVVESNYATLGYVGDLIHSLLAVLMWRNKRKVDVDAETSTSHRGQENVSASADSGTSGPNSNASTSSPSGFLSMFGWLGQSNAVSAIPGAPEAAAATSRDPMSEPSPINIEVIVVPQVLEALFAVLQHVDDADMLKQTLDTLGDALQPKLSGSVALGFDANVEVALKNIDLLCGQRDWITWLCNCYVSFHRRFSVGNLRGEPGSVSESELGGADLSGFESEDSVEISGMSPQRGRRRTSASRQQHRGSARSSEGEGRPTSLSPVPRPLHPNEAADLEDCNSSIGDRSLGYPRLGTRTHLLERYVEPLYTFALRIFKMDLLSKPSQNRRYPEIVNKLPMDFPEARQFQMNLLFDILENIPSLANDSFEPSMNLVKNLAALLEQVAEKIDASIELSVAAVECVNALLYNCPVAVRQRVKDTSLPEMRVLFVTRCLIERNVELEVKALALRDIRSSIVSLVSSNDAKSLQDSQVLLMVFDVFIEAMEEIEYSLEVAIEASSSNLSPREDPQQHRHHPVARAQSPFSVDDAMSVTSHNFVSLEALNDRINVMKSIQIISLEIIQDILNASAECRKYVAKLFDGIENNIMARSSVVTGGVQSPIVSTPNGLLRSDVWRAALTNRYSIERVTEDDLYTLECSQSSLQTSSPFTGRPDGLTPNEASVKIMEPSASLGAASTVPLGALSSSSASNSSWWTYWMSPSNAATSSAAPPPLSSIVQVPSTSAASPPVLSSATPNSALSVPPLQLPKGLGPVDSISYLFPVGIGVKIVDNRAFLNWFANAVNSDFRSEIRDLIARDLKALLRQSEKVHERVMQRRARSVRLCLERITQTRTATAKLARERLDASRQYCTRRANASSKDCKSTVDAIFRRIVAGEDAFAGIKSGGIVLPHQLSETGKPPSSLLTTLSLIGLQNQQSISTL